MPPPYVSTRSTEGEDAHRDFDDWDADQELANLREVIASEHPEEHLEFILEAIANIDESLTRGGDYPTSWHGPECMRNPADILDRFNIRLDGQVSPEPMRDDEGPFESAGSPLIAGEIELSAHGDVIPFSTQSQISMTISEPDEDEPDEPREPGPTWHERLLKEDKSV